MDDLRKADVGAQLLVTLTNPDDSVIDLSTATTVEFVFRKPDESTATKTGALYTDGTDGKVKYVTQSGDLDQVGNWRYQVYVSFSGGALLHSDEGRFKVKRILV